MLAVLYLLLSLGTGAAVIAPVLLKNENIPSRSPLNSIWILLSGGLLVGTLFGTWLVYLIAWLLKVKGGVSQPLYGANALVMGAEGAFCIYLFVRRRHRPEWQRLAADPGLFRKECIFYGALLLFIVMTFFHVLFVKDGNLYAGYTVFSDYGPHLAMARSFSRSANYPTMYPHFGGEDIKYHFMFQFLTGNLEFLGLRLDVAYNLAGILFMWTFLVVLTQLALRLWGKMGAMVLCACFFFFRSGLSIFRFLIDHLAAGDLLSTLADNRVFIGYTPNENWGLWNYNVYLNQRHLAFGLTVAGILIWFYMDYLECAGKAGDSLKRRFSVLFLTPEAWLPEKPWQALFLGTILGMTAFWNGAAVIGCLLILLGFTFFSRHKLDYALTAGMSVFISFLQTRFFISGSAVAIGFHWGFICEDKSPAGILIFLLYISGLTILGGFLLMFFLKGVRRSYLAAMFLPVIFAFTLSLTPDVTVNQKYIMIASGFLAPIWGGFVEKLLRRGRAEEEVLIPTGEEAPLKGSRMGKIRGALRAGGLGRAAGIGLILLLTANGLYDFAIIIRDNGEQSSMVVPLESEVTDWIDGTLRPDQLMLTPWYSMSEVTLSGKMLYMGWPYYAWSAGYDTDYRAEISTLIYTTGEREEFCAAVAGEKISYILFEEDMELEGVPAREDLIADICQLLYTSPDGRIRIYETNYPSY